MAAGVFILILAALAVVGAILLLWYRQLCFGRQVAVKESIDYCIGCKYSLKGLAATGTCPECGSDYLSEQVVGFKWCYSIAGAQWLFAGFTILSAILGPIPERFVSCLAYLGPGRGHCVEPWFDVMLTESVDEGHMSPWTLAVVSMAIGLPLVRVATLRQAVLLVVVPLLGAMATQAGVAFSEAGWNQGVFVGFREPSWRAWPGFAAAWILMLAIYGRRWLPTLKAALSRQGM